MSIISFWSNEKEQSIKPEAISAITTFLAIQHNYKILILDTNYNSYAYQDCYWQEDKTLNLINGQNTVSNITSGINGLAKAILSNKISPEIVTNYTRIVFKDRLEVLTSTHLGQDDYKTCRRVFREIARVASRYYDLVFVDISTELPEQEQNAIMQVSDIIIANISQKLRKINEFIKIKHENAIFKEKPVIPLVGKYDQFSKYNTKNIARYIKEKKGVYAIPYNTLFFEACNEGKVADYFIKFRKIDSKDKNGIFMNFVKEISEKIIYKLQELQMRM